ncbi:MAG: transporter substrate-binding domain-containing protein [Ilumatobacteraceae bacterium]
MQTELVERISAESCEPNGEDAIEPAEYQGATAAISAIQAGTIDGWLDGTTSINEAVASGAAAFATAELPDSEWPPQYTGIAVGKDQPEVSLALVEGLQILIEDGSYGEIMEAWSMEAARQRRRGRDQPDHRNAGRRSRRRMIDLVVAAEDVGGHHWIMSHRSRRTRMSITAKIRANQPPARAMSCRFDIGVGVSSPSSSRSPSW